MGWLDTLLDVGILSLQIAEGKKLKDLQKQQAETALIQSVIQVLRNEIFNFKQSADEILLLEQKYPKIAAGAIQILDLQLSKSELHPDMFFELNDKEYVASTTRLVRENSIRLMSQLSAEEQAEVKGVVAAADTLPDFTYYMYTYPQCQDHKMGKISDMNGATIYQNRLQQGWHNPGFDAAVHSCKGGNSWQVQPAVPPPTDTL